MISIRDLSTYCRVDAEKKLLVGEALQKESIKSLMLNQLDYSADYSYYDAIEQTKYCPKCHRKFPQEENFCPDCLVSLKTIKDIDVKLIESHPEFNFTKSMEYTDFDEIFSRENFEMIDGFDFKIRDYNAIIRNIRQSSIQTFDSLIKENEILLDELSITDKVLLYSKSFVEVDYKSYGAELGYFKFNRITIDDRLTRSLQITTLIHEISHFILNEIVTQILCTVLDCSKNSLMQSIAVFIMSYSPFTRLIDEYAAHTTEGRFTVYGYQDYSSFIQIEKSLDGEMGPDEIEITKSIGNTFAISIKEILESYLDDDMRSDINELFLDEVTESPNYRMLALENCDRLTRDGFLKAIWLVISEGFEMASQNIAKLKEYETYF
ncbi:MAG: zinc ribbon domain-containing protein [Methanobrevibacter sp.]|uniref:zinc ribbon domain-containing protein n=1 Tax=Methanobrevibacter sp. TaxID=66852 RepID=UPI0025ECF594|nr:zinc ribbon domain-containing protein [Methanobrevibacter sp.]MBE6507883.1 zinc ribbon domain-containing protein [Methanobrevibacter sp.]